MKKSELSIIILIVLYLGALWFWTLPSKTGLPWGDVDSSTHFTIGDYMAYSDKATTKLPYYYKESWVGSTKYGDNLAYPPSFHPNIAIFEIIGGHRITAPYIYFAITSTLFLLSIYLLLRKLFGVWSAILTFIFLAVSTRDRLVYLWALWPQAFAFAFIPLTLLTFYLYIESFLNKEPKNVYLVLTALFTISQFLIHPQAFFETLLILGIYFIFVWIKEKCVPLKQVSIAFIITIILSLTLAFPMLNNVIGANLLSADIGGIGGARIQNLDRLFYWFKVPKENVGMPIEFASFKSMTGLWTLPFLFMGFVVLFIKRKRQHLLLIAWLIALYFVLHQDVFGLTRAVKFLQDEGHLFYSVMAIGIINFPDFFNKLKKNHINYIRVGLSLIFCILVISFNFVPAYKQMRYAYYGIGRITEPQYEACGWIKENLPQQADIGLVGTRTLAKILWIQVLSVRNILAPNEQELWKEPQYFMVDYTDDLVLNDREALAQLTEAEKQIANNASLVYNRDYIRIYELDWYGTK